MKWTDRKENLENSNVQLNITRRMGKKNGTVDMSNEKKRNNHIKWPSAIEYGYMDTRV